MKPSESPRWDTHDREVVLFVGGSWDGLRREVPTRADTYEVIPSPDPLTLFRELPVEPVFRTVAIHRYYRVVFNVQGVPFSVFSITHDPVKTMQILTDDYQKGYERYAKN